MISNLLKINYAILLENYNFFISFNLSMLSQHAPVPPSFKLIYGMGDVFTFKFNKHGHSIGIYIITYGR